MDADGVDETAAVLIGFQSCDAMNLKTWLASHKTIRRLQDPLSCMFISPGYHKPQSPARGIA